MVRAQKCTCECSEFLHLTVTAGFRLSGREFLCLVHLAQAWNFPCSGIFRWNRFFVPLHSRAQTSVYVGTALVLPLLHTQLYHKDRYDGMYRKYGNRAIQRKEREDTSRHWRWDRDQQNKSGSVRWKEDSGCAGMCAHVIGCKRCVRARTGVTPVWLSAAQLNVTRWRAWTPPTCPLRLSLWCDMQRSQSCLLIDLHLPGSVHAAAFASLRPSFFFLPHKPFDMSVKSPENRNGKTEDQKRNVRGFYYNSACCQSMLAMSVNTLCSFSGANRADS